MRKLIALGAALGMILVPMAVRPAGASHSLDNVLSNVNGGVELDVDNDGDPSAVTDPDERCELSNNQQGDKAAFTDVVISGLFTAGTQGLAGHVGQLKVLRVDVCVVDDASTPPVGPIPAIPTDGHGELASSTFGTLPGTTGTDPVTGAAVCLSGTLLGGTFTNQAVATSRALIDATYTIRAAHPALGCASPGNVLASSAASVRLEADVAVLPAGQVTQGELPDAVSAWIHSVHP